MTVTHQGVRRPCDSSTEVCEVREWRVCACARSVYHDCGLELSSYCPVCHYFPVETV